MPRTCFVIMPISDPDGYEKGHFRHIYQSLIKRACENAGYETTRADEVADANVIVLDIIERVIRSDMVVCDLSARNANVLYELGIRHTARKPVVLISDDKTEKLFDVAGLRVCFYNFLARGPQLETDMAEISKRIDATARAPVRTFFSNQADLGGIIDGIRVFPKRSDVNGDPGFGVAISTHNHLDIVGLSGEVAVQAFRETFLAALARADFTARFLILDPRRDSRSSVHYDALVSDSLMQQPSSKRHQAVDLLGLASRTQSFGAVPRVQVRAISGRPLHYNMWLAGPHRGKPAIGHLSAYFYDQSRGGPAFRTTSVDSPLLQELQAEFNYVWEDLSIPIEAGEIDP